MIFMCGLLSKGEIKVIRKGFLILFMAQFLAPVLPSLAQDADKPSAQAQLLESLGDGAKLMQAAPAVITGFEELIVRDGQGVDHIFYLSADGNMAFSGSLLDVRHKKNVTQASYRKFVAGEIAKSIDARQQDFIPYREAEQHKNNKPPLYVFLGPSCPACLKLWDNTMPGLSEKYDIRLSYGGLSSLAVKQVRKAMWGWCLQGDKRRAILSNLPLEVNVEINDCKQGVEVLNQMKATFSRYVRHIPVVYNEQGEVVQLPAP